MALLLGTWLSLSLSAANVELADVADSTVAMSSSAGGDSVMPLVSQDGRYVLFSSTANNLALNTNGLPYKLLRPISRNVFLRDRSLGTTLLISVNPADLTGASDHCTPTALSTNGRVALFESCATNLVPGINNGVVDVFVRDLAANLTHLASVSTNAGDANGSSADSILTPDGRYVAFSSLASNLVPSDTNGIADVFVRDLSAGTTTLVSVGAQPAAVSSAYGGISGSDLPEITPDGRFVAFLSTATNLVPGNTNLGEIYVRDLVNSRTWCVSTNAHAYLSNSVSYSHRLGTNGQFVAFASYSTTVSNGGFLFRHNVPSGADNLVSTNAALPADFYKYIQSLDMTPDGRFIAFVANTNSGTCVLLWDSQTAATTLVSVGTNGTAPPTGATCDAPLIDPTGRFVCFRSTAGNLTTNLTSAGTQHLFLRDLQAGVTQLLDLATNGSPSAGAFLSPQTMAASGQWVAFDSTGSDLVTNDNNGCADVFVRDTGQGTNDLISLHHPQLGSRTIVPGSVSRGYGLSADNRFLVFAATGNGIVAGYTNRCRGVFLRDLANQTNSLVSVSTNGSGDANGMSLEPMISGNGRYVVFTSYASNLVPHDTNRPADVFIRDLQTGQTTLVSTNMPGNSSTFRSFYAPMVGYDGTCVAFMDNGNSVTLSYVNLWLRNRTLATNYLLGSNVVAAAMTPDGHYVAFGGQNVGASSSYVYIWDSQVAKRVYTNTTSAAGPLAISTNGQWLAFVASTGTKLHLADRLANTDQVIGQTAKFGPHTTLKFSGDGRFLVYSTAATNVASATNSFQKVYLYDSQTGSNWLVSRQYASANNATGDSTSADLSTDGRYVVYESIASDLVPADGNRARDVFLYDRVTGTTTLVSASGNRAGDGFSMRPVFTGNGQTIVFYSFASDLATNDFNLGGDLFTLALAATNTLSGSTNPPLFNVGQIIYAPGSSAGSAAPKFNWTATPGVAYQVLYKDNLSDANWQPLNGSVTIVGNQGQAIDLAPSAVSRFYCIQAN